MPKTVKTEDNASQVVATKPAKKTPTSSNSVATKKIATSTKTAKATLLAKPSQKVSSVSEKSISSDNISVKNKTVVKKTIKNSFSSFHAVGKRKACVARVWLSIADQKGSGVITINGRNFVDFFGPRSVYSKKLEIPFATSLLNISDFNLSISTNGGGMTGCIDAISLGLSRALILFDAKLSMDLKHAGLLTRDSRVVESKKYGLRKARKREQYSKR
ncbi:30S ribosomal protein S9 [Candidatus Deianiraea vastatrix]|uniref:Small ribosomal subunit protein uS9 n=1 Tax=Candidatus Deianiraea vastatrix TaxID=2163644 RepID=A0A5B8XEJ1_9RICK|nr:30S ribosomal protein S9 [Candidatus Deianiraea vastatrix]QED23305.1 30S ribosomal protein S9 [Candidatus Deianiraea vastatrix]